MNIHNQFTGGNIRVLKIEGTDIYVQNEIRDTTEDWFYWCWAAYLIRLAPLCTE